jgi:alkanesulfonate monooxygenase SsuD/methylene tetrahydromethanopterin reductase-like flavin-dependent oxidoreductase (luciferase family)
MVEVARCAEASGYRAVWALDHLTGSMLDRGWSHDPFVVLGAMAAATERVAVGPLVANMMNRHPVQLALALASLQSLSGGRAVLGIGAGPTPGSVWAVEHEAIATPLLATGSARRRRLVETIRLVDALWAGHDSFEGEFFTVADLGEVVGPTERPPIVVGAGSGATLEVALAWADGVNLLSGPKLTELLAAVEEADRPAGFTVSVYVDADPTHPAGGEMVERLRAAPVVSAVTLAVRAPYDLDAIARLGEAG